MYLGQVSSLVYRSKYWSTSSLLLPPEILEHIIDQLAQSPDEGSKRALSSWLLVSPTFHQRARYHVFFTVTISNTPNTAFSARIRSLRRLLEDDAAFTSASPTRKGGNLIRAIHEVVILSRNGTESNKVILDNTDLIAVMRRLHTPAYGIERFALLLDNLLTVVAWEDLSPELKLAFRNLSRSPFLKSLTISHLPNIPVSFFNGTYLENISVTGAFPATSERFAQCLSAFEDAPQQDPEASIVESPPMLRSFTTDHTFIFPKAWITNRDVYNLTTPLSPFPQLRDLNIILSPLYFATFLRITSHVLTAASRSLETLSFRFVGKFAPLLPTSVTPITLNTMRNLTSLTLSLTTNQIVTRRPITEIGLRPILHILESSTSPPSLRHIQITLTLSIRDPRDKLIAPDTEEWGSFNQALSDFCFANLEEIKVNNIYASKGYASENGYKIATFSLLTAASFAHTWFYMFKYMVWSFSNYEQTHLSNISLELPLRIASWLQDTSLFEEAWYLVCFNPLNWWWSEQLCLFTVGAWTVFVATEGRRHGIKHLWAYMLLGQIVAISVASNLFYLAILLSPPPGLPRRDQHSTNTSPTLWLNVFLSIATVALTPFTSRSTFLWNLLVMHALIFLPLIFREDATTEGHPPRFAMSTKTIPHHPYRLSNYTCADRPDRRPLPQPNRINCFLTRTASCLEGPPFSPCPVIHWLGRHMDNRVVRYLDPCTA
ncbi:unnamed protein product [Cyclocybe aegerita]|uniref:Uncharacterized protein n=1 Tax=Cyclocybe aegerita TaxID=1973307 RepID=A0A8S0X5X3_CYCAE|nr:unnamed protein product [Cyclocybe aegerita]